ncbi:MAG TPA: GDP-mannose 4,6-dehydratase [Firmicutes bacterium]|jgi:GDPmannose 4,6-dehydratase|nr:GDP-mannose 4,6-dehydratase [Bacillota bacterium]
MANALITGITGQDGSYLAELLINNGYNVVGVARDLKKAVDKLTPSLLNRVNLYQWNMQDQPPIMEVLQKYKIEEVYNFAAYSSGAGMYDDPIAIGDINGLGLTRIFEAIRAVNKDIKVCQASSSEMFGATTETPQSEETKVYPRSPYGAAKLYAHNMVKIYRQRYGIFACSAILYNHESSRRGLGFVTKKISNEAVRIKLGLSNQLCLGNLDSYRDWGFAGDYVKAMWLMLQNPIADDYIVATGEVHSVRDFCECAFSYLDLDYRDYVYVESDLYRPAESIQLVGDSGKIRKMLGWKPTVNFFDLVKMMVDEEMRNIKNMMN